MTPAHSFFWPLDSLSFEVMRHQWEKSLLLRLVLLFFIPSMLMSSGYWEWVGEMQKWVPFETFHHDQEILKRLMHFVESHHTLGILAEIFNDLGFVLKCGDFHLSNSLLAYYLLIIESLPWWLVLVGIFKGILQSILTDLHVLSLPDSSDNFFFWSLHTLLSYQPELLFYQKLKLPLQKPQVPALRWKYIYLRSKWSSHSPFWAK